MNENQTTTTPERSLRSGLRLIEGLRRRGWTRASVLAPLVGLNARELRAEAAASGGRVITGQQGYCLIEEASQPEIEQSASWLISQGHKMIARGMEIRRRSQRQEGAL